jgi:hypothetical protein
LPKYQCLNPDCKKTFIHSAKLIEHKAWGEEAIKYANAEGIMVIGTFEVEKAICPFCLQPNFDELTENQTETGNVYVYDLTSGAQTKLDELLAQGYKVTGRYSKQYILEKPKETKP